MEDGGLHLPNGYDICTSALHLTPAAGPSLAASSRVVRSSDVTTHIRVETRLRVNIEYYIPSRSLTIMFHRGRDVLQFRLNRNGVCTRESIEGIQESNLFD